MKIVCGIPKFGASDCSDGSAPNFVFILLEEANKIIKSSYRDINCKSCSAFSSTDNGGRCAILSKDLDCVRAEVFFCNSYIERPPRTTK